MLSGMNLQLLLFCMANWALPVFSTIQGSIPVCPSKYFKERDHNYPYVVYGTQPPQCYVAGRQGPCNSGSVLFAKPNSHLGVCSCKCFLSDGIVFDGSTDSYRYCFDPNAGQTFVYDRSRENCYLLGSQGPCPQGQILYKNIFSYDFNPECVREEMTNFPHTPMQGRCPEGTIYSELLDKCTDMNFRGTPKNPDPTQRPPNEGNCSHGTTPSPTPTQTPLPPGKCPPGTIISTLLNKCVDMNFKGQGMGWGSGGDNGGSSTSTQIPPNIGRCPPGTIPSTLLNKCVDMNFKGQGASNTGGTTSNGGRNKCRPGLEIYSTLLNRCVGTGFRGVLEQRNQLV